jgi:pimeloyl-ACP methyl ester carboxylesterase
LFVLVHGYVEPQEPLALPAPDVGSVDTVRALLDLGFAVATTSFHKNGYAVEQAGNDVNALVRYFNRTAGASRVLLLGASEGALITTMLIEQNPELYAGGLAVCGPLGGANFEIEYLADFRVVFDYFFPHVFDFGAVGAPVSAAQNWAGYRAVIYDALAANPAAAEQLFRVTGVPRDPALPAAAATVDAAERLLRYSVFGINDLRVTSGGNPYDNRNRLYSGSDTDAALNRGVERIAADASARDYLVRYYQPTGRLQRPLVTLHTLRDPIVPYEHSAHYARTVAHAGAAHRLISLAADRYGHCNVNAAELLGAVAILIDRAGIGSNALARARSAAAESTRR